MSSTASKLLANLDADSFRIETTTRVVRLDDATESTSQTYLHVQGTPDAFRWMATLLTELATRADSNPFDQVIVSSEDVDAVNLEGWDSIHLECERRKHIDE